MWGADDGAFYAYTILSDEVLSGMCVPTSASGTALGSRASRTPGYMPALPLIYQDNMRLGSLRVLDTQPRTCSRGDKAELQAMADHAVTAMATRKLATLTRAASSLPL
jgi:hypothetical protein